MWLTAGAADSSMNGSVTAVASNTTTESLAPPGYNNIHHYQKVEGKHYIVPKNKLLLFFYWIMFFSFDQSLAKSKILITKARKVQLYDKFFDEISLRLHFLVAAKRLQNILRLTYPF